MTGMRDFMTQTDKQPIQRRRILMIASEYPDPRDPLQFNGSWTEEQVRALAAHHDVAVVYPLLVTDQPGGIEDSDFHGVRLVTVRYRHVRKTWQAPYVAAAWRGVQRVRPGLQPDCIHAHNFHFAGQAAVLIGRTLGIPVVVTEQWGELKGRTSRSRLYSSATKLAMRNSAQIIAVSKFLADEIREVEPRSAVSVVPNIIGPNFLEIEPVFSRPARSEPELLFVGSIRDDRKGLGELLQALRVYLDFPDALPCRLTIIGEGGKREWFEELATTLGLGDRCRFVGNQSREGVAKAMLDCDVFVMPSKYETFGVVYAEALACGKPVIACQGGPAEEIVPDWAGALALPGDHLSLADAIRQVLSGLENYDARRIADYARQKYGPEGLVTAVSRIYETAIQGQAKGTMSLAAS
jgi:L-malate glycosyltransferase